MVNLLLNKPLVLFLYGLKDLNFMENNVQIIISSDSKATIFHDQIQKDCQWFAKHLIMDYSLLVGIAELNGIQYQDTNEAKRDDDNNNGNSNIFMQHHGGVLSDDGNHLYFLGIIDILQKYNKKKKAAAFVKGMKYDSITLSTVPPDIYSTRFCDFFKHRVL